MDWCAQALAAAQSAGSRPRATVHQAAVTALYLATDYLLFAETRECMSLHRSCSTVDLGRISFGHSRPPFTTFKRLCGACVTVAAHVLHLATALPSLAAAALNITDAADACPAAGMVCTPHHMLHAPYATATAYLRLGLGVLSMLRLMQGQVSVVKQIHLSAAMWRRDSGCIAHSASSCCCRQWHSCQAFTGRCMRAWMPSLQRASRVVLGVGWCKTSQQPCSEARL